MPDIDWGPWKDLAKSLIEGGKEELDDIKEEHQAALETIKDQALEQAKKLARAKIDHNDDEIKLRKEALDDLKVQAEGVMVDAALDAMDAAKERLRGFVRGAFKILLSQLGL